ncbi:MAG: hypothetical protein AB7O97_19120 [Planctomycetota bacterium]
MSRRRAAGAIAGAVAAALLLTGCGPQAPWPEAPPVAILLRAELSQASVPLLQPFDLTLDLFHRADLPVDFDPQVPAGTTGQVELQPEREFDGGTWRRAVLHLRATRTGELRIAPFEARAADGTATASSDELRLDVTSVLPDPQDAELEAPGPLLLPPRPIWPWVAGGGGALLLLLLAWWWSRRPKPERPAALAIEVPPHTRALRELARLRGVPRKTAAEVEAFYVATAQVLRVYLEERFGLRAPERTTEEFLQEIEAGGPLSAAQCLEVRRFLQQCDLVKFAAVVPTDVVHLETLAIAEQLVEATRADRAAAVSAGVGA